MKSKQLAVYTTVYPAVVPYLATWYRSVISQTDRDFDLWIAVDSLSPDVVRDAIGASGHPVNFIVGIIGSPAEVRQHALELLVPEYSSLVFVDSDDLLYPTRVEAARRALEQNDVSGCALTIIDDGGVDLGITFGQTDGEQLDSLLPRYNIFGLSNTAYRSEVLRRCLPLAEGCELVDWLLATRAWAHGARMTFDNQPHMAYRQYPANVARVLVPFSADQVLNATRRVIGHYRCALESGYPVTGSYADALRRACERASLFQEAIRDPQILANYVAELNRKSPRYVWWWCVAHPDLEHLWRN